MSRQWMARMLIVVAAFFVFAAWCLYDGLVRYPAFNRRAEAYNNVALEEGGVARWEKLAREHGWPTEFRRDELRDDALVRLKTAWDIRTQFVMAGLCLLVVIPVLVRVLWARSRTLSADAEGFTTVDGVRVPYEAIRGVDKSRWQRKSIAVVIYEQDGRLRQTKIDDWIFAGAEEVLRRIEEHAPEGVLPPLERPAAGIGEEDAPENRET